MIGNTDVIRLSLKTIFNVRPKVRFLAIRVIRFNSHGRKPKGTRRLSGKRTLHATYMLHVVLLHARHGFK